MFRRSRKLLIAAALVIVMLAGILVFSALASGPAEPYTVLLKYYDNVQITYKTVEPNGNIHYDGAEDIMIGGMGTSPIPVTGTLNPVIASQVYCIDPFTPFASNASGSNASMGPAITNGLGETWGETFTRWKHGYVSSASWSMSGVMQQYENSIRWLVYNGYRGDFRAHDQESAESLTRLNRMYGALGEIDKTIAVMATKVAIWRVLTDDSPGAFTLNKTSLDATREQVFYALVDALIEDAHAGGTPSQPGVTSFSIDIANGTAIENGDVYIPLTLTARLDNADTGADLTRTAMDRVYLTVSGSNTGGAVFVYDAAGATPLDGGAQQYLKGTDFTAPRNGVVWTSPTFYLKVPAGRTPAHGDSLTISAEARINSVPVAPGMPIAFVFSDNDDQQWTAVQAFIGAARPGSFVDLYADANLNTGTTPERPLIPDEISLTVRKALAGSHTDWGVTPDTLFRAKVQDSATGNFLTLSGTAPNYYYTGTSPTGSEFTFSARQPSVINGIPADMVCYVAEVIAPGGHYEVSYSGNGTSVVTVTNTYEHGSGNLIITKALAGSYEDWGVDETTVFYVKIKDVTNNNYLYFKNAPEANGSYWCIGNDVDGLSEPYSGTPTMEVPVSAGRPLIVTNLWVGAVYEIEEKDNAHCTTTIDGNGAIFSDGENNSITVINTYDHGTGNIVIRKKLAGSFGDWGVDTFTTFTVRVKDVTDGSYLMFKTTPEANGGYWCVGNTIAGLSEAYTGPTTTELTITAGRPLAITNLWIGHVYEIEEISGGNHVVSYEDNDAVFSEGENSIVTITNTYGPGPEEPNRPNIPEIPNTPPPTPSIPNTPIDPNEPPTGGREPPTGDSRNPMIAIAMILAGAGLIVLAECFRRYKKKSAE